MLSIWCECRCVAVTGALLAIYPAVLTAQDLHGWKVDSKVSAVQLVSAEQFGATASGPLAKLDLKNVSRKAISAVVVVTPDEVTHMIDYFASGELAPAAIHSLRVVESREQPVLKILAVVFVDGSSQGLPPMIAVLKAKRMASTLETRRLLDILSTLPPEQAESDAAVESLLLRVGPLPPTTDDGIASLRNVRGAPDYLNDLAEAGQEIRGAFLTGVRNTREDAIRDLSQLRRLPPSSARTAGGNAASASRGAFLASQREKYEDLATRQQRALEAMK